jgi:hypothetical protein
LNVQLKEAGDLRDQYSDYRNSFELPSSLPYQSVNCSGRVYKGLPVFISACQSSYRSEFYRLFNYYSKARYSEIYEPSFQSQFTLKEQGIRTEQYDKNYKYYYDTVYAQGLSDGKKDLYNRVYKRQFQLSYNENSEAADENAHKVAKEELDVLSSNSSLPTVLGSTILNDGSLRAGDEGYLKVDMRNGGAKETNGNLFFTVQNTEYITFENNKVLLGNIPAQEDKSFKVKFKVNQDAVSTKPITIDGSIQVVNPHQYQSSRHEKLLAQTDVDTNPFPDVELRYDSTPKIKGIRKYWIHTLRVKLKAKYENLDSPYKLKLKVLKYEDRVELKNSEAQIARGANVNTQQDALFKYVFKKSARRLKMPFEITILYKGEVVSTQVINLWPK